jgi:photosystem II stability/assembly factor-like uncharacterized protein
VQAVRFVDSAHGWTVGSAACYSTPTTQSSFAWSTSDGGATWTVHTMPLNQFYYFMSSRLQVPSASVMRFTTQNGPANSFAVMLTTEDGGATFQTVALPAPYLAQGSYPSPTDLQFRDASNGMLLMANGCCLPVVYTTSDGGKTWIPTPGHPPGWIHDRYGNTIDTFYRVIDSVDATHIWLGGGVVYGDGSPVGGLIEPSSDGGATWITQRVGDGT